VFLAVPYVSALPAVVATGAIAIDEVGLGCVAMAKKRGRLKQHVLPIQAHLACDSDSGIQNASRVLKATTVPFRSFYLLTSILIKDSPVKRFNR
jgi:hypothetical protein